MAAIRHGRARRRAVVLAVLGLAAAGCWPQQGGTSENQNANLIETDIRPDTVGRLARAWSAPGVLYAVVGDQILGADASGPDLVGPGAFSRLRSLGTVTGAERWAQPVTGSGFVMVAVGNGATVQGDRVMVGIYGALGSGTTATVCGDTTFALALDGTGQPVPVKPFGLWNPNVPLGTHVAVENSLFLGPGTGTAPRDCAFQTPRLEVYDDATSSATSPVWTAPGGGRPVVVGDQLLVAAGSTVRSYVASGCGVPTCDPVWSADLGVPVAEMAADAGDRLHVLTGAGTGEREVLAVDRRDGSVTWRATLPGSTTGPASLSVESRRLHVAAGTTVSTFAGAGCGAATCAPDWTAPLAAAFAGNLASGGGVVFATDAAGHVEAWDGSGCGAATCAPLATVAVAGAPTRTIQSGGSLFVETDDPASTLQTVTAFALAR